MDIGSTVGFELWICDLISQSKVVFKGKVKKAAFKPGGGMPEVPQKSTHFLREESETWRTNIARSSKETLQNHRSLHSGWHHAWVWTFCILGGHMVHSFAQNINARAVLISGPPGIGKTTACRAARRVRATGEPAGDRRATRPGRRPRSPGGPAARRL